MLFQEILVNDQAKWDSLSPPPRLRDHLIRRFVKKRGIRCRAMYKKAFSGYDMPAVFCNTLQIQISVGFLILTPDLYKNGPTGFHDGTGKAHKDV